MRALLIGLMLWELTAFQGRYLDLLINGIVPDVPLVAAVLLVSFTMTAALLLPLTTVGMDAAIGLLVSALVQQRTYSTLLQAVLIFVRVVVTGGAAARRDAVSGRAAFPVVGCRPRGC